MVEAKESRRRRRKNPCKAKAEGGYRGRTCLKASASRLQLGIRILQERTFNDSNHPCLSLGPEPQVYWLVL